MEVLLWHVEMFESKQSVVETAEKGVVKLCQHWENYCNKDIGKQIFLFRISILGHPFMVINVLKLS